MSLILRVELILFAIICMISILWVVKKEKLLIKYALVWLLSGFSMIVAVIIPNFIEKVSHILGFETASNMIFLVGILILLGLVFSLTIISSKHSERIRLLIQEISMLKSEKNNSKGGNVK